MLWRWRRPRARGAICCASLVTQAVFAVAQTTAPTEPPVISVAAVVIAEPATQTPLPIQVGPPEAIPRNSFLRVRGLPTAIALTEGHSVTPGTWAVPLAALPALRITAPVGSSGKSELAISLVAIDGTPIAETKAVLVLTAASALVQGQTDVTPSAPRNLASLGPRGVPPPLPAARGQPERQSAPAQVAQPPQLAPAEKERVLRQMQKAEELLGAGDIAAARLFLQKAAEGGWGPAALALAETFDPAQIARWKVRGVGPDAEQARRWYEKARELGAADADLRLKQLGAR